MGGFNAARGFVCGASPSSRSHIYRVQGFNAARGFVCGARTNLSLEEYNDLVSMPLAALFVVQGDGDVSSFWKRIVSMPLAALFVVQDILMSFIVGDINSFNAARGFVCGARSVFVNKDGKRVRFQCRSRLCLWCKRKLQSFRKLLHRFQCRSRLCLWCKMIRVIWKMRMVTRFNAARGFVCGASPTCARAMPRWLVSMPLAALFVVQGCFQALFIEPYIVSMPLAALFVVQGEHIVR